MPGSRSGGARADDAERAAAELVREAPLREAGHRLLMEALAARGEIAEALAAYERLRVLLRDELGMVPGEAARALHERLLTGEAAAAAPRAPGRDRLPERLAQALASPWVGRQGSLRRLRERAELAHVGGAGITFVTGEGGIGKTRLVAELAHRRRASTVLYGRCDEEELFPFGPWIEMLRRRAGADVGRRAGRAGPRGARAGPAAAGAPRAPARARRPCRPPATPRPSGASCTPRSCARPAARAAADPC